MIFGAVLVGLAAAQGLDGHGVVPPPGLGITDAPVLGWTSGPAPGRVTAGIFGELAVRPLVRHVVDGPTRRTEVLLSSVGGLDLGGAWGITDRVGVAATLPIWLGSSGEAGGGPVPGDLHLWVPVELVQRPNLDVVLVPEVGLPTGAPARYLGNPSSTLAATLGVKGRIGALTLGGWLGNEGHLGKIEAGVAPYRSRLGMHAAWHLGVGLALTSEILARPAATDVPVEWLAGVRGGREHVWWSASLGTGLTRAPTSSAFRVLAGIGGRFDSPRVNVGPAGPVPLVVVDPDGAAVRGATVIRSGVEIAVTGAWGAADVKPGSIRIEAQGFLPSELDLDGPETVALAWAPVPVEVGVIGRDGETVAATLTFAGEGGADAGQSIGWTRTRFQVPPGSWRLLVEAPGYGTQERHLRLAPRQLEPERVDVVLHPIETAGTELVVRVADPDGTPIAEAEVEVGGRHLGTTGSGGDVRVEGLPAGVTTLRVAPRDHEASLVTTELSSRSEVDVSPAWSPGSVKVRVWGPDGPVADATIALRGVRFLPPVPVGPDGSRVIVLSPGRWVALISSPSLGTQERALEVTDDAVLQRLDVVLRPDEGGQIELRVSVVDPEATPLPGVKVSLDGLSLGATGPDGTVSMLGLRPGTRGLAVEGELLRPARSEVALQAPLERVEVVADWVAGAVHLRPTAPPPSQTRVALRGPEAVPPLALDEAGTRLSLAPGPWEALITAPSLGMRLRGFEVAEDSRTLQRVVLPFGPGEGGDRTLSLSVRDPDGIAVRDASLTLDGGPLGVTGPQGGFTVGGLVARPRQLRVASPGLMPVATSVDLAAPLTTREVALPWAPAAVVVRVAGPDGPVADARVIAAGPIRLAPRAVDSNGRLRLELKPGDWTLLVSSASAGMVEQAVTIEPDATPPLRLDVRLEPTPPGLADLLLEVVDGDRAPVAGAAVHFGEVSARTSMDGSVLVRLPVGQTRVQVDSGPRTGAIDQPVTLTSGPTRRTVEVPWRDATVRVVVRDAAGSPLQARLEWDGPEPIGSIEVDASGQASVSLRPGQWYVAAFAPGFGAASAPVTIDDITPREVELVLGPERVSLSEDTVRLGAPVLFELDVERPKLEAGPTLDEMAALLLANPSLRRIEVQGHTDDTGGAAYNLDLSTRRAHTVRDALIARGVAPERLLARGYGLTHPVGTNDDEASRARNRRVELAVLSRSR